MLEEIVWKCVWERIGVQEQQRPLPHGWGLGAAWRVGGSVGGAEAGETWRGESLRGKLEWGNGSGWVLICQHSSNA